MLDYFLFFAALILLSGWFVLVLGRMFLAAKKVCTTELEPGPRDEIGEPVEKLDLSREVPFPWSRSDN